MLKMASLGRWIGFANCGSREIAGDVHPMPCSVWTPFSAGGLASLGESDVRLQIRRNSLALQPENLSCFG